MTSLPTEAELAQLTVTELTRLGWEACTGNRLAPGSGHRRDWDGLILHNQLREAITRLNPGLPSEAVSQAVSVAAAPVSQDAYTENRQTHAYMTHGIGSVVYTDEFGARHNPPIRLIDLRNVDANRYALSTDTALVGEDGQRRRLDLVLYVNGLPVAVIETKRAQDGDGALRGAHRMIQRCAEDFPAAFRYNVVTLLSSGTKAVYGTPFTPYEQYAAWNVDESGRPVRPDQAGEGDATAEHLALRGLFNRTRLLRFVDGFIDFTSTGKRIARPHQYFAATKAARSVVDAFRTDGRAGVVAHAAGSGKSWTMVLTSGVIARDPALNWPTLVVVTDNTERDHQLFATFQEHGPPLEPLYHADSREELRGLLSDMRAGGTVFTTLQKFGLTTREHTSGAGHPTLSERRNIVVIVDEAHRSHRSLHARHLRGALPNATLLAFTSVPLSSADRMIRQVFGGSIDAYDLERATCDGVTVPVHYEDRTLELAKETWPDLPEFDEESGLTAGSGRRRTERTVADLNTTHGSPARVHALASDLVEHWEQRRALMTPFIGTPGKAMVVCATREMCVRVFEAIQELRPGWAHQAVDHGTMKIVFSGLGTDPDRLRSHALTPAERSTVVRRAQDPDEELELLIVHSMLLTGFDAPPVHTMYLDRSLKGNLLMQAMVRVNRRFRGKPDGLLVGYVSLADNLRQMLAERSDTGQAVRYAAADIDTALDELRKEYDALCGILAGIDWRALLARPGPRSHLNAVLKTLNHLRDPRTPGNDTADPARNLGRRYREHAYRLERFHALTFASTKIAERFPDVPDWRSDLKFMTQVSIWMARFDAADREAISPDESQDMVHMVHQLAQTAGPEAPATGLQASETPHLATEAMRQLAERSVHEVTQHNVVRRGVLSARLRDLTSEYERQRLTTGEIIAELTEMVHEIASDTHRGERFDPALSQDELAFYDAIAGHGRARDLIGDAALADIARALVTTVRRQLTPDWVSHEPVRARLRSTIKRLLARHGYPPAEVLDAVELITKQLEYFAWEWTPEGSKD
ncbi:type I restriction endonuclease subunit R [[Kitasatospora] papulosa]|uniref:type I restriction endonuclease subunit R n=1 Tax=Streptomyces TaxID=1883 RepID=UPI00341ACF69